MSASEILQSIAGTDAGNHAEEMMVLAEMGSPIPARIRKAHELGFWTVTDEGVIVLTEAGRKLVAK